MATYVLSRHSGKWRKHEITEIKETMILHVSYLEVRQCIHLATVVVLRRFVRLCCYCQDINSLKRPPGFILPLNNPPPWFFSLEPVDVFRYIDKPVNAPGWEVRMHPEWPFQTLVRRQLALENQFLLALSIHAWPDRSNTVLIVTSESMV